MHNCSICGVAIVPDVVADEYVCYDCGISNAMLFKCVCGTVVLSEDIITTEEGERYCSPECMAEIIENTLDQKENEAIESRSSNFI